KLTNRPITRQRQLCFGDLDYVVLRRWQPGAVEGGFPLSVERLVDPGTYQSSSIKVLWLLKEMNDPDRETKGMIPMIRDMLAIGLIQEGAFPTCGPIAKISYGLLHPADPWERWSGSQASYIQALASIAIVNLKDEPGGSTSNESEIRGAFEARQGPLRDKIS